MTDTALANRARQSGDTRHGVVILAMSIMPIMAIISLVPVLPLLMREFADVGGSEFLVPMALTIPALCVALFSPFAGWLADRVGRKNLLVVALVFYAGFGILPWFLDNLFQIIGARIALGITEAVIMTGATTLIGDYFEGERREKWIALQVAVGSIAAIVLVAVGGALGDLFGSRGPFLLYLVALPIAVAAAVILFEPFIRKEAATQGGARFPFKATLPLIVTTLGVGIVFYTMIVQLGPILGLAGPVSPGTIGIIGAMANVAVGAGTLIFHKLKHSTGAGLLAFGLAIAGLGYAGTGLSSSFIAIAAFAILTCIGSGILLPNMLTWIMRRLPAPMRGRGTGMWTGAFFLGQFLAPLVIAATMRATSGMAQALVAYAIVIAIAALCAVFIGRRPKVAVAP